MNVDTALRGIVVAPDGSRLDLAAGGVMVSNSKSDSPVHSAKESIAYSILDTVNSVRVVLYQ